MCKNTNKKLLHATLSVAIISDLLTIAVDAPKSYVIIFAFLGNERLAVYGRFLVLRLRISTQTNTVTTDVLFCSILFGMKGRESEFPTYPLHYYVI